MSALPVGRPGAWAGAVCAVLVAMGAGGCTSDKKIKTCTVSGRVVYKGKGEPATKLEGALVILESVSEPGNAIVQGESRRMGHSALALSSTARQWLGRYRGSTGCRIVPQGLRRALDPRYTSFDKSGIRLTINEDKTDVVIEVEPHH